VRPVEAAVDQAGHLAQGRYFIIINE